MNIIDIIIIAILALSIIAGMYKGFIASLLSLFGFLGAWVGAYATYGYLANMVMANDGIRTALENVTGAADLITTQPLANLNVASATQESIAQVLSEVHIPLINELFKSNVVGQVFANKGLTTMSEYLSQTLLSAVVNVLSFIVMFIVIYIAVSLVVHLLNNVFRFPKLRHADWLLGGLGGLVRGAVIVMLIFAVVPSLADGLNTMNIRVLSDLLDESKLGAFVQDHNLVTGVIANLIK